jgi:hypothetical protein
MSSDEILTSENVHLSRPRISNEEHQKARAINCTFFPDIVAGYVSASLANNTQRAYLSDLAHFEAWGGTIPADPATISALCPAALHRSRRLIKPAVYQTPPAPNWSEQRFRESDA